MGQPANHALIALAIEAKKGVDVFQILFGEKYQKDVDDAEEVALGNVLAEAKDGWPFHLSSQAAKLHEDDVRWIRLLRFLRAHGAKHLWWLQFMGKMGDLARADTGTSRENGRRLMWEFGITY